MVKNFNFKHKLTGQLLAIKNIKFNIATCYIQEPYIMKGSNKVIIDVCICNINNLEYIN
jgi:hypothetical protein